jgi:hypothetical protein
MKVSYMKELAIYHGPESCLDVPQGRREALSRGCAGIVLSSEIFDLESRPRSVNGKATVVALFKARCDTFGGVIDLLHVHKLYTRKSGDPASFLGYWQIAQGWSQ